MNKFVLDNIRRMNAIKLNTAEDVEKLAEVADELEGKLSYTNLEDNHGNVFSGNINELHIHYDKDGNMTLKPAELNPMEMELMPMFMNNYNTMHAFVVAIDGAKPTSITELVNKYVKEGKILKSRCQHDLWKVLNKYGLYKPDYPNWNKQVN